MEYDTILNMKSYFIINYASFVRQRENHSSPVKETHTCYKHIIQPPKDTIIIVRSIIYIDNSFLNRCLVPLDLNITLGSCQFSLQATIDHPGIVISVLLLSAVGKITFQTKL